MKQDIEFTLPGNSSELYLLLEADYKVKVLDSAQGNPTGEVGDWSVIYDQGIVVELPGKHQAKYAANFAYRLKEEIQES